MKIYQKMAQLVAQNQYCAANENAEWEEKSRLDLQDIAKNHLPSGSGVDGGTRLHLSCSTPDKLCLTTGFNHMNDGGFYNGWTEHTIIVRPSLVSGFTLSISGRDRNDIKTYLDEIFTDALSAEFVEALVHQDHGEMLPLSHALKRLKARAA